MTCICLTKHAHGCRRMSDSRSTSRVPTCPCCRHICSPTARCISSAEHASSGDMTRSPTSAEVTAAPQPARRSSARQVAIFPVPCLYDGHFCCNFNVDCRAVISNRGRVLKEVLLMRISQTQSAASTLVFGTALRLPPNSQHSRPASQNPNSNSRKHLSTTITCRESRQKRNSTDANSSSTQVHVFCRSKTGFSSANHGVCLR